MTVFLFENLQAFSQVAEMYTYRNPQANSGKTVILTKYALEKIQKIKNNFKKSTNKSISLFKLSVIVAISVSVAQQNCTDY